MSSGSFRSCGSMDVTVPRFIETKNSQAPVEQILSIYNDRAPLSQASTIPAPWYVDPRIAELEGMTVFSKTWQVIGRADQVTKPGQFVTSTLAGEPIVWGGGGGGAPRGFF